MTVSAPPWLVKAESYIGFHEIGNNQGIEHFIDMAHTGSIGDPWCAIFVNANLEEVGVRGSRSPAARSFTHDPNFVKLAGPALGAIAVRWRGSPSAETGHVYFYLGENSDGVAALAGNTSDKVQRYYEDSSKLLGYYWPKTVPLPSTGAVHVDNLDSPLPGVGVVPAALPSSASAFLKLKPEYDKLLSTMELRPETAAAAMAAAEKVIANSARYKEAGRLTGVPWQLIGVLDLRESGCDPTKALGQGDPWNRVSVNAPSGKGPFKSYVDAAVYYIGFDHLSDDVNFWDMSLVCWKAEKWNGLGYRNHGVFTPYLWAMTNHQQPGRYAGDGNWQAGEWDKQPGIIAVLYQMNVIDPANYIGVIELIPSDDDPPPDPIAAPFTLAGTRWIQSMLNILMPPTEDLLRVDGDYGRLTSAAVRNFQARVGLEVDGDAGDDTCAAIDRELSKIK
jgi:uncharacterized protein (TIGR02594 family)